MIRISSIVEGHGERSALPVLLRRIASWRSPRIDVEVNPPIRVPRNQFLNKPVEFRRYLQLAGGKCGNDGWVLILLDADNDCPAHRVPQLLEDARRELPHRFVSVVFAMHEFEAWFIGAAASLNGQRGLTLSDVDLEAQAEEKNDAKGWLNQRMGARGYGETRDQAAFAATMDLQVALDRCRSFRKLCAEWDRQFLLRNMNDSK